MAELYRYLQMTLVIPEALYFNAHNYIAIYIGCYYFIFFTTSDWIINTLMLYYNINSHQKIKSSELKFYWFIHCSILH